MFAFLQQLKETGVHTSLHEMKVRNDVVVPDNGGQQECCVAVVLSLPLLPGCMQNGPWRGGNVFHFLLELE